MLDAATFPLKDNFIVCRTSPGEFLSSFLHFHILLRLTFAGNGVSFVFTVAVGVGANAQIATGTDQYSYPVRCKRIIP